MGHEVQGRQKKFLDRKRTRGEIGKFAESTGPWGVWFGEVTEKYGQGEDIRTGDAICQRIRMCGGDRVGC